VIYSINMRISVKESFQSIKPIFGLLLTVAEDMGGSTAFVILLVDIRSCANKSFNGSYVTVVASFMKSSIAISITYQKET
jgi:hypothetical protein